MNNTKNENSDGMTRRTVLKNAAGVGLTLLLAGRAGAAADRWVAVGKADVFALNIPQRVTVEHGGVLSVTRTGPTALTAVSAKCTHRGCEVAWAVGDKQLQCPCHGAAFAADGKNIHGTRRHLEEVLPALVSVPVRQKNGMVEVNLTPVAPDDIEPVED